MSDWLYADAIVRHRTRDAKGPAVYVTEDDLRDLRRVAIEAGLMAAAAWIVAAAVWVLIRGG